MNEHRQSRLEKRILRLLGELYFRELHDPNIGFTTFTRCQLSRDTSHVKIFVSIYEVNETQVKTLQALKKYIPLIRGKIARNIRMKKIPTIRFELDDSLDKSESIEALLSSP